MRGIIAKIYDSPQSDNWIMEWQDRLRRLSEFFTFWTETKTGIKIDFQEQLVAMPQRKGTQDNQEYKDSVRYSLDWRRGSYLQLGFDTMIFIYDKYEPWLHTPENDPEPLNTTAFTNVGDTATIGYIEPQFIGGPGNKELAIKAALAIPISMELLHILLYRKQMLEGRRPDPKYFDDQPHGSFQKRIFDIWPEGFVTVGGNYL